MNRLILVGNGFDLAHGLRTDYNSFVIGYLKKCLTYSFDPANMRYEDELIDVTIVYRNHSLVFSSDPSHPVEGISDLVDYFYEHGLDSLMKDEWLYVFSKSQAVRNPFRIKVKSSFFNLLLSKCNHSSWVEIENEFYRQLNGFIKTPVDNKGLDHLNESLRAIIRELGLYLSTLDTNVKIDALLNIIEEPLNSSDERVMVLNFNYTDTVEKYVTNPKTLVNYIHGKIGDDNNPLIFGFGDELDTDYHQMELKNNNRFFEFIKTFWYLRTTNYDRLSDFIQRGIFNVSIIGHSCGLSDRTLLNMIFEHNNCNAVQIYYHQSSSGNNYTNLTYEISRHFRDKIQLRAKVTALPNCKQLPQLT